MSNVVSFRCSEELDEFLEQEAERRMTTKSTVAQMLLVERVREMREDDAGDLGDGLDESESADQDDDTPDQNEVDRSADEEELPEIFHEHEDMWQRRGDEYEHNFSVRAPREGENAKYYQYKTVEHAKNRLEEEFGE